VLNDLAGLAVAIVKDAARFAVAIVCPWVDFPDGKDKHK